MKGVSGLQEIPLDDKEWWSSPDEAYWQALLEQGMFAPETVPPSDPQEAFQALALETEADPPGVKPAGEEAGGLAPTDEWQSAQLALDNGQPFCLVVSGANRGGLLVNWNGLQGFVPASHLKDVPRAQHPDERVAELTQRIGDKLTLRLIEVNAEQKRLVLSERAATPEHQSPAAILNTLRPGDVRRGVVTNLTTFGAFVDLGGVEGLIHVSEISWDRVRHPRDVLGPGQEVQVYVLGVNPDKGRIALSLKRMRPDPWSGLATRYRVGDVIEGTITNVVSFGAFVRVAEGLEGLVHASELAEGNFMHPRSVVREGDRVRVRVLKIDPTNHRLGLSLRQAQQISRSVGVKDGA